MKRLLAAALLYLACFAANAELVFLAQSSSEAAKRCKSRVIREVARLIDAIDLSLRAASDSEQDCEQQQRVNANVKHSLPPLMPPASAACHAWAYAANNLDT